MPEFLICVKNFIYSLSINVASVFPLLLSNYLWMRKSTQDFEKYFDKYKELLAENRELKSIIRDMKYDKQ